MNGLIKASNALACSVPFTFCSREAFFWFAALIGRSNSKKKREQNTILCDTVEFASRMQKALGAQ